MLTVTHVVLALRVCMAYNCDPHEALDFLAADVDKIYIFTSGKVFFPGDNL